MYGLFIEDQLMASYPTYLEALQALNLVYRDTQIPHELKVVREGA